MDTKEKTFFTRLKNDEHFFNEIIGKLTSEVKLSNEEFTYILGLSILFSKEYDKSKKKGYFEFAYYLVLLYSINSKDYTPLFEFSINNGLYPIAKFILNKMNINIINTIIKVGINDYTFDNRVDLKEQKDKINNLLYSQNDYRAFIAPTSYGKSSFVIDDLKNQKCNFIGIIVPKKALIWQTFRSIKVTARELGYRILMHDTEYSGENKFIGIFTQERAIRLLHDNNIYFDLLYIDEAHNIFEGGERSVLLARLIKLNKKVNNGQKVVFLSPLISDINNLKIDEKDFIETQKIDFNIKEYKIQFLDKTLKNKYYNRFTNTYYDSSEIYKSWYDYLTKTAKQKNLIYLNSPKDIERIANDFNELLDYLNDATLDKIAQIIEQYVDKDYLIYNLIKKGVLYIHGKMPDSIKDYLIEKYKKCSNIKYLISNSSVMEGVNFPIENLYIFNVYSMDGNKLKNLCGRVNRLNEIFAKQVNLNKLICPIYFVNTNDYGGNLIYENKIELLRSDEKDDVVNPLLLKSTMEPDKRNEILSLENEVIYNRDLSTVRIILLKNNISSFYKDFNSAIKKIESNIVSSKILNSSKDLISFIYNIFLYNFEPNEFADFEFSRLNTISARRFYGLYLDGLFYSDIKSKVKYFLYHFSKLEETDQPLYIGISFGDIPYISDNYQDNRKVYISTKEKTRKEKVNIAVIKSKIEDDFVSYKLTKIVKALFDLQKITDDVYNKFIYNTLNKEIIKLLNSGLNFQLIKFLTSNNLINDINYNNGVLGISENFKLLLQKQDDYIQFEINKML